MPCPQIGNSLFDAEGSAIVGEIMAAAERKGVNIHLPVDHITGDKFDKAANVSDSRLFSSAHSVSCMLCLPHAGGASHSSNWHP